MKVLTGVDIVDVAEFRKALRNGGQVFVNKVFLPSEQKNSDPVHLAGVFAAKEAVNKALSLSAGKWLEIEISYTSVGRPKVRLAKTLTETFESSDLSITHTDRTAVAVFVVIQ